MKDIKRLLNAFSYYFVDFFMAVIVGLGIVILLNIPLKFLRVIHMDLSAFIVHFLSMCTVLYIRSYRRGYHRNTKTYAFAPQKAILFVGIVFVIQIALILMIGGHAVYITGPTVWLNNYIFPTADSVGYDWPFMIGADILIYAPIMILAEYFGDKQNRKELAMAQNDES